jgi:hypothetical protein
VSSAELPIPVDRERLNAFCRARGVHRLSLFGSMLRPDFDPARSDVDVLVGYLPGRVPHLAAVPVPERRDRQLAGFDFPQARPAVAAPGEQPQAVRVSRPALCFVSTPPVGGRASRLPSA